MRITLILASCAILWTAGVAAAVHEDDDTTQVRESRAKTECARWSVDQKVAADKKDAYTKTCIDNHLAMTKPEAKKAGGGDE